MNIEKLIKEYETGKEENIELKNKIKELFTDTLDNWVNYLNKKLDNNDNMILVKFIIPYYYSRMNLYTVDIYTAIIDKNKYLENKNLFTHYEEINSIKDLIQVADNCGYFIACRDHCIFNESNILTLDKTTILGDENHINRYGGNDTLSFINFSKDIKKAYYIGPAELKEIIYEIAEEKLNKPKVLKKIK